MFRSCDETSSIFQVVWGDTEYVGCGYTNYQLHEDQWYDKLYVCNYGPG
jgi:hypothetical protein